MKSTLNIHWKDWCWSWNSNTLIAWCKELTHWNRPWCLKRLKAGREGYDRGWDGWMASPTWCTWVWASSRNWWWTGQPGILQSMSSQGIRHDWVAKHNYWIFSVFDLESLRTLAPSLWNIVFFFFFAPQYAARTLDSKIFNPDTLSSTPHISKRGGQLIRTLYVLPLGGGREGSVPWIIPLFSWNSNWWYVLRSLLKALVKTGTLDCCIQKA